MFPSGLPFSEVEQQRRLPPRTNHSLGFGIDCPVKVDIPLAEPVHAAVNWLLNYTAAGLPIASSPVYLFWNRDGLGDLEYGWSVEASKTLKSLLAFVFWQFSGNNWGNPAIVNAPEGPDGVLAILPPEFHTVASTANPLTRFTISRTMFVLYIVFQIIPIISCWIMLLWRLAVGLPSPHISSFPLLDLIFKSRFAGKPTVDAHRLADAGESDFIRSL
jgi:hypothetical protein